MKPVKNTPEEGGRGRRTALEPLKSLLHILFAALALLEFLELHLLPNLLAFALAPARLALCNACALVKEALSYALHVRIRLDHFCKKVVRPCKGETMFCGKGAGGFCAM